MALFRMCARKLGEEKVLGVSTHSLNEALAATDAGANYVGVGPLFDTDSKEDAEPASRDGTC